MPGGSKHVFVLSLAALGGSSIFFHKNQVFEGALQGIEIVTLHGKCPCSFRSLCKELQ